MLFHERIRQVPKQFSWLDHRLVQQGYIDRLSHRAMSLYLFLVTVGDANGVSFYSDKTLQKRLTLSQETLLAARQLLLQERLLAYQKPFYQVLSLSGDDPQPTATKILTSVTYQVGAHGPTEAERENALRSIRQIVKQLREAS